MILAAAFNPILSTSGSFVAKTLQVNSKMIVINKSYVDILFTFSNGDQRLVIANDRRAFTINVGSPLITWSQQNIDYPQTVNQLENIVYVEIYEPSEIIIEQYPSIIQRETLPNLLPYNVGSGSTSLNNVAPNNAVHTIFCSSYLGISICPATAFGCGFDHFYASRTHDEAGGYPATGKVGQDCTTSGTIGPAIAGPFSLGGIAPVDSAINFLGGYYQMLSFIPWASSTSGFLVDFWVNLTSLGGFQNLFGDGDGVSNGGLNINVSPSGVLTCNQQFTVTSSQLVGSVVMVPGQWYHVAYLYTGTTTNTTSLWLNGISNASATTSGTPVNSTNVVRIGSNTFFGGNFVGGMANIGILLTYSTTFFMDQPNIRYMMGLQSLNQDYQNAWITGYDIMPLSVPAATYSYSFSNIAQTAGLLYVTVTSQKTPLHPSTPINQFVYGIIGQNTAVSIDHVRFPGFITHSPLTMINFNDWVNTGPRYTLNIYGYNLLAVV
jgi:hypothetical protein